MNLEAYKEIVGTSAAITTMGHMLSGTLICKDIYQKGTAKGFDPMPFVGGIGICLLMLRYSLILADESMIKVNVFGLVTNIAYMTVFYLYSPNKMQTLELIGKVAVFVSFFMGYAQWEDPTVLEFRFGIIVTVLLLMLVASPLIHLGEIIRTKNTEILPFPLILMGTLVSVQWLLYGLIINNSFIIFQNGVGFTLNVVQLSLFAIFPSPPKSDKVSSTSKKDK